MSKQKNNTRLIAQNKKAFFDFFIEDTIQAGISLLGCEVKSMRAGRCNLKESYVIFEGGSAFISGMHVSPYEQGNIFNKDPLRKRRLLLHKAQINKLQGAVAKEGYTVVPVKVYLAGSLVKIDIALAKGKKQYDKREDLAKKAQRREAEKDFKVKNL